MISHWIRITGRIDEFNFMKMRSLVSGGSHDEKPEEIASFSYEF